MKKRNESKERLERLEVVRLYKENFTLKQIAEKTGLGDSRIRTILYIKEKVEKKQGLARAEKVKMSPDIVNRINQLTNFGYDPCEISDDVCVPTSVVTQIVSNLEASNRIKRMV